MKSGLALETPPAEEPVSLEEMKEHLRVDAATENALIASLTTAARQHGEAVETWSSFVTQTWKLTLDGFPSGDILLARPPIQSVESVEYVDPDGETQTLDADLYRVAKHEALPRITRAPGATWPATENAPGAVTVTYVAGYGDAEDMPEAIKAAIKLHVGSLYEHRESVVVGSIATRIPQAVTDLYAGYRYKRFG